ncbi:MAG TPA: NAD-dependent epimerase/dehydratase family protein, partial [Candidatus Babeliaceae bacterium]|nr:NAD-dependent epimerase/dehydratase family protein [Candidatus Babeliaceae bacterium]
MKLLLSGTSGFVGSNLRNFFLERHFDIFSIDRVRRAYTSVTWGESSEVLNLDVDAMIHLAGKAHDISTVASSDEYFIVNTELTKQLFDLFLKSSAMDFIYFSSVKAAADSVSGILDENVTPCPKTPYGQSKRKAEEYILTRTLPPGKRVIILRPCMIHGLGNKGNLNLLYQIVRRGIPYPLGKFNNLRSFTSIENLCFLVEKILLSDIPSGIYNIADDEPLSTVRVIEIMAEELGQKKKVWEISPHLIRGLAKAGSYLYLPFNAERLKKLTES